MLSLTRDQLKNSIKEVIERDDSGTADEIADSIVEKCEMHSITNGNTWNASKE